MNYEEASKILLANMKNAEIETALELTNGFVFSTRPKGSPPGFFNGVTGLHVSKETGEIVGVLPGDPLLRADIVRFIPQGGNDE